MQVWSTDDVPERDRFAVWKEWRAAHLYGLTAEIDRAARRSFHARITTQPIGSASLVELNATPYHAHRTARDITRVRSDSLCIYQQVAGSPWTFRDERKTTKLFPTFGMAIGYSDMPYETDPLSSDAFTTRLVQIPLTRDLDPDRRRESMLPRLLRPTPGLNALLHDYIQSFFRNAADLDATEAQSAIEAISRLALLAHVGAKDPAFLANGAEAVGTARLGLVQAYIRDNLHRPDLSPEIAAGAFQISVRQVHRLFQPSGTTFARYLLTKRVERAAQLLRTAGRRTIIEVAFACGFSGSSVFYRAFKDYFGLNPHDYLRSVAGSLEK
jgi:AraC-like DNA-binding protein